MSLVELEPIGTVVGGRTEVEDDDWGRVAAVIELDGDRYTEEALRGLDAFTHLEVVFHFHKVAPEKIETTARRRAATRTGPRSASSPSAARTGPTGWASPAAAC